MPLSLSTSTRLLALAASAAAFAAPPVAQAADVAIFKDATYTDIAEPGGEATNLEASLVAAGHDVTPFTGIADADFRAALAGKDAIVLPEQEKFGDGIAPVIGDDAKATLRAFVSGGGNFITFAQHKAIIDAVFGYHIGTTGPYISGNATKQAAAAQTPYADGPETLAPNSAVYGMDVSKLPASAKVAYQATQNDPTTGTPTDYAVVALIPYGKGTITYFGWDWFNSSPPFPTGEDGGWQALLSLSTTASELITPPVEAPVVVPTPQPEAPAPATPPAPAPAPLVAPQAPITLAPTIRSTGVKLTTSSAGRTVEAALPLVCPAGPQGCEASGTLTVDVPAGARARRVAAARAASARTKTRTVARFSGVRIAAGEQRLLQLRLSKRVVRDLQAAGISRVRAALTVENHLAGGASVRSVQDIWLAVPAKLPTCVSRRKVALHWRMPAGERVRRFRVTVGGKRIATLSGRRRRARVDLSGRPAGAFQVAVIGRTRHGARLSTTRTFRTCAMKRTHHRRTSLVLQPLNG